MARGAASGVGPLMLLVVGCSTSDSPPPDPPSPSASRPAATDATNAACPHTAQVPSASVPAAVRAFDRKAEWHGAGDLWVLEPRVPEAMGAQGYHTKYVSITLDGQGQVTDRKGAPRVDAERLDGSGSVRGSTGGFATDAGGRHWWPTVIDFGGPGCWQVTETLGSTEVRFTMHVTPR
ncbi:hypothetical protein [Streptomyces niveiscabiei]|uniref:Lipoprotein n=1 Tax=Streptomyces niveiscabiei TaxID=164115 RepID=A0ABW9HKJ2_9ACTN